MLQALALCKNKDFKRLYHRAKPQVHSLLVTYSMKNGLSCNRIGIAASKKIGHAVSRNRARRIIREAFRLLEPDVSVGRDIVFVARGRTVDSNMPDVQRIMRKHLQSLGLL